MKKSQPLHLQAILRHSVTLVCGHAAGQGSQPLHLQAILRQAVGGSPRGAELSRNPCIYRPFCDFLFESYEANMKVATPAFTGHSATQYHIGAQAWEKSQPLHLQAILRRQANLLHRLSEESQPLHLQAILRLNQQNA